MKLDLQKLSLPQLDALKGQLMSALTAPERRRALLLGAAAVFALGVWYFALIQPIASRVTQFKARHETAHRAIYRLGSPSAVEDVKARVTAAEARVRTAFARMSQGAQLVQILKQLSTGAARYQIVVEKIDVKGIEGGPKPEAPGKGTEPEKKEKPLDIRTEQIEMTLSCSYEATARLLDGLKTLPAFMIVDRLTIERDTTTFPNLKVLLTLKLHSIKQLPEELTKI